jgi:hypothetical protein
MDVALNVGASVFEEGFVDGDIGVEEGRAGEGDWDAGASVTAVGCNTGGEVAWIGTLVLVLGASELDAGAGVP